MATPGELIHVLAKILGVSEPTVFQHDRNLVKAGYRRTGGRGRSAVKVDATDAANLLIAVVGTPISGPAVKDSVATFKSYSELQAVAPVTDDLFARHPTTWKEIACLRELAPGHGFATALATIIRKIAEGAFEEASRTNQLLDTGALGSVSMSFTLGAPLPFATISVRGAHDTLADRKSRLVEKIQYEGRKTVGALGVDLSQTRSFTHRTVALLANLTR